MSRQQNQIKFLMVNFDPMAIKVHDFDQAFTSDHTTSNIPARTPNISHICKEDYLDMDPSQ